MGQKSIHQTNCHFLRNHAKRILCAGAPGVWAPDAVIGVHTACLGTGHERFHNQRFARPFLCEERSVKLSLERPKPFAPRHSASLLAEGDGLRVAAGRRIRRMEGLQADRPP